MSAPRRAVAAALVAALALGAAACTDDGGPSTAGATSSTSTTAAGAGQGAAGDPGGTTSTAPRARDVGTCASITAPDLTGLGVEGLTVAQVQDVSDVLQGPAKGGTGCWFSLAVAGSGSANLTVLTHPDGGAYFDAAVARLSKAEPIPGLGDDARTGSDAPGSTTVITRRGPLVVEVRIGRDGVLPPNLLIAIAGLALEREDQP